MKQLRMTYRLLVMLLFGALGSVIVQAQPAGYQYYKQVTIQASQVQGSHSNFPVLISITDTDLRDNVENTNGYDILFSSDASGNTILNHQIESYNAATGQLIAWVQVPAISGSANTDLYMFYGNSGVNSDPSTTNTWSSAYTSVYHFNNLNDATATANNATNHGSTMATGRIGSGRQFDGNNDYLELSQNLSQYLGQNGTMAAWVRTTQTGSNTTWQAPGITGVEQSGGGNDIFYGFINGSGEFALQAGDGSAVQSDNSLNNNQWHHVVFTRNSGNGQLRVYVNGSLDDSGSSDTGTKSTPFYSIGRIEDTGGSPEYFQGRLDEVIISNQIFGANLIRTTYNNQNNPSAFISVGNQQTLVTTPPDAPQNVSATAVAGGSIQIQFDDVNSDAGVTTYSVKRSTAAGGPFTQVSTIADNESATYSFTDTGVNDGTTYYYVITALDGTSNESDESDTVSATADGTGPQVQSASVDGSALQLDFNEALASGSVPAAGDFTVRVNGTQRSVSTVVITGSRINLSLSSAVVSGDNVEVDYSQGTNPVEDQVGNATASFNNQPVNNITYDGSPFGPDPCPITNGHEIAWACFDGITGGTTMDAIVGGLEIATVDAAAGSQTTFAPNALQSWSSGDFAGDEYNGPQANPGGATGNTTSLNIEIPSGVPSDALILALNRLGPNGGNTSYTLEAYNGSGNKIPLNNWPTGQGTDGGVCTNNVNLVYTNGNTTLEFRPTVSGSPTCTISSTPVWLKILSPDVERIELRKIHTAADNIFIGLGLRADFGDAPAIYSTTYSSRSQPPAFHLLNNAENDAVYLGNNVTADGNGQPGSNADGDNDNGINNLPSVHTAQQNYGVSLSCTNGGTVGGWVDFDQSGTFDAGEFAQGICASGSVSLNWNGLSGLVTGTTYARFRIASNANEIANPTGSATDGEVEDYTLTINPPPVADLSVLKSVDKPQVMEGDVVIYTIQVGNASEEFEATGVQVTDQLPDGVSFVSAAAEQGSYDDNTGIWNVGTLAPEDTVSLEVAAEVDTGTLGSTIQNEAALTAFNQTDPDLTNNTAEAGITVIPETAEIQVQKTVSNTAPFEGEYITYTITATNNGPKQATNLTVTNQIPSGLTFQSATTSTGSYNQANGIWTIGSLANGASASLNINVTVDEGTEGNSISGAATINTLDQNDPNTGNNTASAEIEVVIAGMPISCNERPFLTFTNGSRVSGSAEQVGAVYEFPNVMNGVYARVEVITIQNAVLKNIDDAQTSNLPNDFSPFVENVGGGDGYVDFRISFFDAATDLPRYLSFAATTSDVDGTGSLKDLVGYQNLSSFTVENTTNLINGFENNFITFESNNFQDTQPGYNNYYDYMVYATYTNESVFNLRAGIKSNGTTDDRIISVSFDPCKINEFEEPDTEEIVDVGITKKVNDNTPDVGQDITYTVKVTNTKSKPVSAVEISDELPGDLNFQSASASQGSYDDDTGIWTVGGLQGFESASLQIVAEVRNGREGETIVNSASLEDIEGVDLIPNNNSTSVSVVVNDPNSNLSCTDPPTFTFLNYSLEQGIDEQEGAVYRFSNVASGLDALVRIVDINNAQINAVDDDGTIAGNQVTLTNFSPIFANIDGQNPGYIDWEITIVETGTNTPVKSDFSVTALDIDGTGSSQYGIRDYYGFAENQSYTIDTGTNIELPIFDQGDFQIFRSDVYNDAQGLNVDHMAYIRYKYTSTFQVRSGSYASGGYTNQRMVEYNFTECLNQEFSNPNTQYRNADIAVTKTVDEENPLENETINFTINVTNNGPQEATELEINEALPAGLTLIKATPSKGSYNQISKIWSIGSLQNGNSASLALQAQVDSGVEADSLVNKAFINGINQFDPNVANDTSKVVIRISAEAGGVIFRDKTGNGISDGDTGFDDASGDQTALQNVKVHLFKDGGDGIPDGNDDVYKQTTQTGNNGTYAFQIGEQGEYWVAVDSRSGALTNGTSWAEQTYAPKGSYCSDGAGGSTVTSTAGTCYGGRRGTVSDNLPETPTGADMVNAEHIAKLTMNGQGVDDLDFGFSFNVVTNTLDGDDDASANRSVQGSLRQFIQNANSISGSNAMRFVPAEPANASGGGGNWWSITLNNALPAITDALTTINGTAYNRNNPQSIRNDNPGTVGTGGVVGTNQNSISVFNKKELELNLNDAGQNAFTVSTTGAVVIKELALYNNIQLLSLQQTSSGLIERNLIGLRASGENPGGGLQAGTGIDISVSSSLTALLQQNYIAFTTGSGVQSRNANATVTFYRNEVYQTAKEAAQADGLDVLGTWTIQQNLIHENGHSSSHAAKGGSGIEIGHSSGSSQNNIVRDNTIRGNRVAGITMLNNVSNSLVEHNVISGNGTNYSSGSTPGGAGIKLTFPDNGTLQGINITENSFFNNYGLAIDIVTEYGGAGTSGMADGVSPNDGTIKSTNVEPNAGLDYPVFTLATVQNGNLRMEGFVGTNANKLSGTYTIEIYKAEDDGNNEGLVEVNGTQERPHGEGRVFIGSISTNPDGTFNEELTIPGSISLATNNRITAIAIDGSNNTSEFSANQRIVPTGISISGYVFNDDNHNGVRENGEQGIQDVTMVMYNVALDNCKSVLTDADGFYQFGNVLNGEYELIEAYGQSIPTPDVCKPTAKDPPKYLSITPNSRLVDVNNNPATMNFADFKGARLKGTVYNDNGINGGTANNGQQDGDEAGISGITVKATANGTVIHEKPTGADGLFEIYISESEASDGSTILITEEAGNAFISTGGEAGTTAGTYDFQEDEVEFSYEVGEEYTGVKFANVQVSRLLTDGEKNLQPGTSALFQHTFDAKTDGKVTFSVENTANPDNVNWPVILYNDQNCNNEVDSGEPILEEDTEVEVTANTTVCLLLKVTVPQGVATGGSITSVIEANFVLDNITPEIEQTLTRTDLVHVSITEGGLVIIKEVNKGQALPGALLTYTIDYQNNGSEPINSLEILDDTPAYTSFSSATCNTLPNSLTDCTIENPGVGKEGVIRWVFDGSLAPGASGTVTYVVKIYD